MTHHLKTEHISAAMHDCIENCSDCHDVCTETCRRCAESCRAMSHD